MANFEDFLEMFNNEELDVKKYFGDYQVWFNLLNKRGLIDDIDPHNAGDGDVWQNDYFLWLYNNDKPKYYYWMNKIMGDVIVEDGKAFWQGDRSDLAQLFCDGRRYDMSQDTVEKILSHEGDIWDSYSNTTDDVYRDVIEELNSKNIERLKEYIIDELKGKRLSPETEEMESIATEQGHNDYWEMNTDVVARIIDDEESMNSLLDDELPDLRSELFSIHSNAYNSAYETSVYDEVFNELKEYFDMDNGKWVMVNHPYKQNTQIDKFRVPILNFEERINNYLYNNKDYGSRNTLEYYGSFIDTMAEENECLHAQPPDYPDHRLVDKNINEYFSDFI